MKKTVVVGLVLIFCQVVCFHVTMAQKSNMPIAFMPKLPLLQNRSYGQTNITSTNKHESVSVIWKKLNAAFLNHPDAGFVDKYRPSNKVVELFEKRTANSKYFVHADTLSKFYQVKSNTALHYLKDGQWLTIDERLEPISKYIFEASRQEEPVGFNVKKQHAYIKTIKGQAFFNNWYLYGLVDGKQEMLSMPNWSLCKLGDQCVYITNIFPGIDAEMLIGRGFIKTSFIIKANFFPQATQLIFKDAFSAHNKASLKANTTLDNQIQTLDYVINGEEALHIDKAVAYSESEVQESAIDLFYSFSADTLSFAVSAQYINLNLQRGRVIVDPLISTSNSISQATITGSMDCGSYNFSCNYSMTVPSPPKTTITDVYFMFGFQTVGSALNKNGFWSIKSGTCGVWVLADSTKAAYNLPGTTSTFGSYDQITPFLINCMPAPSCISIDIPFTLGFYNNICTTGSACSENYIKANEPFVIMIEGRTVELFSIGASKDTICEGDQVTLTAQGIWGVPPYTYSWDNGGGAGQTVTVNPTTTTTYTLTITDQCGNTASGTVLVVVKPSPTNVIPSITSNSPVCEFADLQLSAATIIGATYNWTGPNGFSSNDQNPVYTNVPSSASGDYTLFVTLNGCSSQTSTIPVVVNSSVASVSISASATVISEGTTVTFTATPVNGGVSPSYQWKVNGVNVGTNSAAFTSNTLINNDVVSCTMTGSDPCTSAIPSNLITIKVVRVDNISDQTLCNGASTTAINFTGTGSSYTWTNDNPAIGLAESGTENIPSFTVVNNGSEPDTAVVTVTPKGGEMFAYVANQGTNTVSVIDLVENKVLKTIVVGNHPIGLVYSPLHNRIYVVQDMSNQICVINAETYAVLQNIPVGNNPGTVALSLDEKYLYVSNETSNTISVINTFTNTVVSTIPAIGNPRALALSVDGSLLYVGNTTANTVSVINTSTNTEVANIVVGTFPVRICVSPDGRYVYVTNRVSNSVSVIDAISNLLIATISVGLSPYCFTLSPDFQKLYVANSESNTVSIINTSTNVVESTFSTATRPFGIVSSKFFDKVYISNFSYFSTFNTTLNTIDSIKTSGIFYGDVVLNERFTSGTPKTFMIIVNPTKVPTININASATSICAGTTVTFNAAITNGGSSPVYQWKVNGANVGTNSSTYSSSTLKNNDIITCVLTSNETCASPTVVTSNSITMKVNQPTTSTTIKTVCPQALPYVWNANSYTVAGSYTAHFTNATGCDSTATLQLSVKVPSSTLSASICEGESYTFNEQTYTKSGTYTVHITTATGCDSLANLILQVNLSSTSNTVANICEGESYTLGGVAYNKTGNYTAHLINKEGCDSTANLQLTVYQPKQISISEEMCDGQVRSFGSQSLTGTGIYSNHFLTTYGCDSAVTLSLTVKPTYLIYRNKSMLYGETDTINGNIYDKEGVYRDVFVAANGCDSTIVSSIKIVRSLCPKIIVPPFFTPNGDGNNDFLEIENINCYLRSRVNIFDRYGKLLVNYSGLDLGWDGRYLGNPMPSTDYWYEIILPETGERFVGHFILKR